MFGKFLGELAQSPVSADVFLRKGWTYDDGAANGSIRRQVNRGEQSPVAWAWNPSVNRANPGRCLAVAEVSRGCLQRGEMGDV